MIKLLNRDQTCPDSDLLCAFLEGVLDELKAKKITQHLETCSTCQQELESLTSVARSGFSSQEIQSLVSMHSQDRIEPETTSAAFPTNGKNRFDRSGNSRVKLDDLLPNRTHIAEKLSLAGYDLFEEIGRGGMATVFRGRHIRMGRDVAIKVMPHRNGPTDLDRHYREMTAVGRLGHPNIVQAYDAGCYDEWSYIVMEFLDGVSLKEIARHTRPSTVKNASNSPAERRLSVESVCNYVRQAAVALHAVHEAGLVHRDVKPSNLILVNDTVKLVDLGLVRFHQSESVGTVDTDEMTLLGTFDYVAPEQIRDATSADARSDIYSLGCTLYTLLAGQPPFSGQQHLSPQAKMLAHACDARPDVREVRPDVPRPLARLIESMMSSDPSQRPNSATEVVAALRPFKDRPNSTRRGRNKVAAGFLALTLLAIVIIVIKFQDGTSKTIEVAKEVAAIEVDGIDSKLVAQPLKLKSALDAEQFPNFLKNLEGHSKSVNRYRFFSDGKRAVSAGRDGRCIVWDLETGKPTISHKLSSERPGSGLALVRNESAVIFGSPQTIAALDLKRGKEIWTAKSAGNIQLVAPNDGIFLHVNFSGAWIRSPTGEYLHELAERQYACFPYFSTDQKLVVAANPFAMTVDIYETETGTRQSQLAHQEFRPFIAQFITNNQEVVAIDELNRAVVWNVESGEVLGDFRFDSKTQARLLRVGATDTFATVRSNRESVSDLQLESLELWNPKTGKIIRQIDIPRTEQLEISWDGHLAMTDDWTPSRRQRSNTIRLWDLSDASVVRD